MNSKTRVLYPYNEAWLGIDDPKFIPYNGPLPPIDFKSGVRIVPEEVISGTPAPEPTEEQRIERLAAVIHLVPKEEVSDSGMPSIPVIERIAGVPGVKAKEVRAAMKMRDDMLRARNIIQTPPLPEGAEEPRT